MLSDGAGVVTEREDSWNAQLIPGKRQRLAPANSFHEEAKNETSQFDVFSSKAAAADVEKLSAA